MALVDTTTGEIVSDLTRGEARDLTDTIKSNVDSLWSLLKESHDRRAWKALGYTSWREYATSEFGMSQSRAYQLLDQARVVAELEAASSTTVELSEREARDLKAHLDEARQAVGEATKDALTDEERQERVRQAIDSLRSHLVGQQRATHDGESSSDDPPLDTPPATRQPESQEQRDAREAEERRVGRNVAFGKYLIGLWALLGDGEKPVQQLLEGWVPDECPMWLVDAHKPVFTADGIRAVAAVMEKLASEWESRV